MTAPTIGGGDPVVVDAQELRRLANAARNARSAVDYALSRMAGIMGPLDRRGWNAGAADGTWASARSGLQHLEADLEQHGATLNERANLVDRFDTRAGSVLDLVEQSSTDDRMGQPTSADSNLQATDTASIVQALIDQLTPEQAAELLAYLGVANPNSPAPDNGAQPSVLDQLGQAKDSALGFVGDRIGEAKQAEDALGRAKDAFLGDHATVVDPLKSLLGMLAATPGKAPPVTCADGQIRLSQDAADLLNGQKTLNPDISQQDLSLLAAAAAARCGQLETSQHVVETPGGPLVVSTMHPKDLWDALSQRFNHDEQSPPGDQIVEPDTPVAEGPGASGLVADVAGGSGAARTDAEWSKLIGATDSLAQADEVRYQRYLAKQAAKNTSPIDKDAWQKTVDQLRANQRAGRSAEDVVLVEADTANNNYGQGTVVLLPDGQGGYLRPDGLTDTMLINVKHTEQPVVAYTQQLVLEHNVARAGALDGLVRDSAVIITNNDREAVRPTEPLARNAVVLHMNLQTRQWSEWTVDTDAMTAGWTDLTRDEARALLGAGAATAAP